MVAPASGKPRRAARRKRKGGKRSRTDLLNGILAVRLKDGACRFEMLDAPPPMTSSFDQAIEATRADQ